jgi:hypothetical protein
VFMRRNSKRKHLAIFINFKPNEHQQQTLHSKAQSTNSIADIQEIEWGEFWENRVFVDDNLKIPNFFYSLYLYYWFIFGILFVKVRTIQTKRHHFQIHIYLSIMMVSLSIFKFDKNEYLKLLLFCEKNIIIKGSSGNSQTSFWD